MAEKTGTGILIGRFQVFQLERPIRNLIEQVRKKHKRTVLFLNSNPAPSDHNPLHFLHRQHMFAEVYGETLQVLEMPDLPDDRIWSQELDRRILDLRAENPITLYGSPEMLENRYSGNHEVDLVDMDKGEYEEETIWAGITSPRDFRLGILYATLNRFPTVYPTVDIAIFSADRTEILLARKENETRYRFPGGFTDPTDDSYEDAALRELMEECGEMVLEDLVYLGSVQIDDWRYRNSSDTIITHLYACTFIDGDPNAGDDIAEVRWFPVERLRPELFVQEHQPVLELLENYLDNHPDEDEA